MNTQLQQKLTLLPEAPGCYIYKDENQEILYIGKSKCLKKPSKVLFYWQTNWQNSATRPENSRFGTHYYKFRKRSIATRNDFNSKIPTAF